MTGHRKTRSDTGTRLTQRDIYTIWLMGEQYALRFDQLQRILGAQAGAETKENDLLSDSAARHAVNRWKQAGLVEYKKILVDSPGWTWPTLAGLRQVGLEDFKFYRPSVTTLNHLYWITQARRFLTARYPASDWTAERYLRARTNGAKDDANMHTPDAEIRLDGEVIPVEIELTQKSATRLRAILDDLLTGYRGPIWYFVAPDSYQAISAAWKQLNDAQRSRVSVSKLELLE
jgi:hypothetical protein